LSGWAQIAGNGDGGNEGDGTQLATDYYLPERGAFVADDCYSDGVSEGGRGARGRAVRAEWLRGRSVPGFAGPCKSEGAHNVFYADGWRRVCRMGAETIRWVRRQPWSNGKVATYGESALGMAQIMACAPSTQDVGVPVIRVALRVSMMCAYDGGGLPVKDLSGAVALRP